MSVFPPIPPLTFGGMLRYIPFRSGATVGEIMEVRWVDYDGAALFGDKRKIACIPHKGCRLEIVAAVATAHREVNLLLPGAVIRYKRSLFLGDRFELPGGTKVSLRHLVGFKLQLAPSPTPPPAAEEVIVAGWTRRELE